MKNSKKVTYIPLLIGLTFLVTACSDKSERATKRAEMPIREMRCLEQQSACFFDVADGRVEILFDVNKIIAEQAFNMSINYTGAKTIIEVNGYMEGVDMFMGKIPLFLEKKTEMDNHAKLNAVSADVIADNAESMSQNNIQAFQGEVLVGSCSAEKMTWKIWLTFTDNDKKNYTKMLTIISHRS
ncbi:hypothetical protein [Cognaticolwellia mytili]|uniref:hypothetical protein n=1 Tax=Cognaticolwellia mytili TaxID=1888913 RepID=UPI00117E28CA|nr:hypothetical protein [Cognaticolwellia mytili]